MNRNVLEYLEDAGEKYRNKIAVKDINTQYTFDEILYYSRKIGSALLRHDIFHKTIPVYMDKGADTILSFWGITYAGGCYSLINTSWPKERINTVLQILDAPILITDNGHYAEICEVYGSDNVMLVEDLMKCETDENGLRAIRDKFIDTDPLYVNFTSGSTGVPKGVVVGHKSVIEFIGYFINIFNINSNDIIGNQAPFDFDVSVKDIYSMLFSGASLYIIPKDYFLFPKKLLDTIEEQKITTLIWAVSALCLISSLKGFRYKIPVSVNKVLFSGEVMPLNHLKSWQEAIPNARFVNLYGPTEITCNCTYYEIENKYESDAPIPIGRSFPNERVFLLNDKDELVTEVNTEGEICVTGSTLALGYYRNPEHTNEAFIQNPLNKDCFERLYRTGDIGYLKEDGNLVYVGRKDFQIKHMGHRIELGEIEAHINTIPGIERVCCLYDGEREVIIAFYQGNVDKKDIKDNLKGKLITYMIPKEYVQVDRMPMTMNGKIDRKKLLGEYI